MSTKTRQRRDPFRKREAEKYEHPIPSREFIIDTLAGNAAPVGFDELVEQLGLTRQRDQLPMRRRLRAMERDGQLIRNRHSDYGLLHKMDLTSGAVIGHRDGFGFLSPDDGSADMFLPARQMRSLFHGDRAVVRVARVDRQGRREAALVNVLERNTTKIVGRYLQESGFGFVRPDNKRIHHDVLIPPGRNHQANRGDIVVVEIVEQPSAATQPIGRVIEVIGAHMAPGMETDIAVRVHDIPEVWPAGVVAEAEALPTSVASSAKRSRDDYRSLPFVTIDGADARDFDDAVHCHATPRGWKLYVAIADVSHYVKPNSELDREAQQRGNSVYFPNRVIPMLPEALSNGLCSLNPRVDRLCLVCELLIDQRGEVARSAFFTGVLRSHARLTYEQVADALYERSPGVRQELSHVLVHLEELDRLYRALKRARNRRGALEIDSVEARFLFGEEGKIESVKPYVRNDAHRLIEECMIAANVAAARFLQRHRVPALYRVHEGPNTDKLEELRVFLGELGLRLEGGEKPTPKDFANVLNRAAKRPDAHIIQTVLLRSLNQAVYSPNNVGHFGLGHSCYTHFTSPIRRYADLLVHRAIKQLLLKSRNRATLGAEAMLAHGHHTSMTERRADDATRDSTDWLKCEFMLDKLGRTFPGTVSGVTSFGLFVTLDDIFVDGLIHVSNLGQDFFHFDPVRHRLAGGRTGQQFSLGDRLSVVVAKVDLDARKLDFELAGQPEARRDTGPRRRRSKFRTRR